MDEQVTWQDVFAAARRKAAAVASDLAADPRTQEALSLASAGASAAARTLDPALRRIVPDASLSTEIATAVDELVEVVLVQQELIENLLVRMSQLERAVHTVHADDVAAG